jgi:DNA-binding NarL/FixJ family response regulator
MSKPLNIIVADFHPYMLKGIIAELESDKSLKVVAALPNFDEIESVIIRLSADIVILEYWFKGCCSLETIKKLHSKYSNVKFIVYTQESRVAYIKEILTYVDAYILKSEPEGTLKNAIHRILQNKKAISEDIRESLELEMHFNHTLSSQEHKILNCRIDGMNPNYISEQLSISEKTVRKHIDNARKKLGFDSTESMVRWFWRQN